MTNLAMTKILVSDLDRAAEFYGSTFGFQEVGRFSLGPISEVILRSPDGTGGMLVVMSDGTSPPTGEAMLVFDTDDLNGLAERIVQNGGTKTYGPSYVDELKLTFALFADHEGHRIELIQQNAS